MASVKLAFTSDLYLPVTPAEKLRDVARLMAAFAPDAAILAGDLAESLADFTRALQLFRGELACPVWVLPGDVDFWARPPYDSHRLWKSLLPKAVGDAGCQWLEGQAFVHDGVAVAGTVAWYDYSSSPMAGMVTDLEFAQHKYLHNADALRIDWEWSDPEFAGQVGASLLANLTWLEQDAAVGAVVVATHFPIFEQQLVRKPGMGYAGAYAGNLTLGRKVLGHRKLTHVVSGHAHVGRRAELPRSGGLSPVEVHVLPGDYEKPGWLGLTVTT
jgi:hypothetical protein